MFIKHVIYYNCPMFSFKKKRIYLDYASTTPVLPEVKSAMDKYWSEEFHNPSSIYEEGVDRKRELEEFRTSVSRILGVQSREVVFTSGGTESDNLAILGAFEEARTKFSRPHLIVSSVEHPAVSEASKEVIRRGGDVSVAGVDEEGLVQPINVLKLLRKETFLVSIMLANNEIGTIEPVTKIARLIREDRKKNNSKYPYIHTDASQAPNYLSVNAERLQVDMLTLDGSKIYGPKGCGVLVVRGEIELRPILVGGSQEGGMRAGTENLALIAGFTKALECAERDREMERARMFELREFFINGLKEYISQAIVNGPKVEVLPNIVSVSLPETSPGVLAELLVLELDQEGVLVSRGSSCSNLNAEEGSIVMRAIGKHQFATSTLRFSFGRFTTKSELKTALEIFSKALSSDTLK